MARGPRIHALRSFQYPAFRYLWVSAFLWAAANWMQRLAVSWLVLKVTGSPFAVALVFALNHLPILLLGPFVGILMDRVNRKHLLMANQVAATLTCIVIALVAYSDNPQVWLVMVLSFVFGVSMAFNGPLINTLMFDIVDAKDALNANALRSIGQRSMSIVGATLGGVLTDVVGVGTAVMVSAGILLVALGNTALMKYQRLVVQWAKAGVFRQLAEGVRHFRHNPPVKTMLLGTMVAEGFGYGSLSLLPLFADEGVLDVGSKGLGVMQGAIGMGGAVAGFIWAGFSQHKRRGLVLALAFVCYGVAMAGFSVSDVFLLSLAALLLFGIAAGTYDMTIVVLLQGNVPTEMRGRVMGAWSFAIGIQPLGAMVLGALAEAFGVRVAMASAAGILVVTSLFSMLAVPHVRRLA
ncbi:MAG: MFS transporter [SAR202 cluster bacterium]|nr:MFS transporter [SAR202 cluster bacterium]